MLPLLLCSILSFSMFPSVSAQFVDDRHQVARVVVGAIIGLGCFVVFLVCMSYMMRRRRRPGVIPLRQSLYHSQAGFGFQPQPTRSFHSASHTGSGYEFGYNSHLQSHNHYSNINLPTYNPPDIPPPAYAKE